MYDVKYIAQDVYLKDVKQPNHCSHTITTHTISLLYIYIQEANAGICWEEFSASNSFTALQNTVTATQQSHLYTTVIPTTWQHSSTSSVPTSIQLLTFQNVCIG